MNYRSGVVMEALWEAMQAYGARWMTGDQVAVARDIEALPRLTSAAVTDAIKARGLSAPRGMSTEVVRLVKRWS